MDDLVVAEPDRKLGDHIKNLATFNKAWSPQKKLCLRNQLFKFKHRCCEKLELFFCFCFCTELLSGLSETLIGGEHQRFDPLS